MALDALLARLEGRAVTSVTGDVTPDVTPKPATIQASTPLRFSPVTPVTPVTAKNDDTAGKAIGEPLADPAMEARRATVAGIAGISVANPPEAKTAAPDPAMEARRQRLLAMLRESPIITYAVVTDSDSDPDAVIVAMAIRGKASFELLIPRAKWDGVLFLELLDKHCGTLH